MRVSLYSPPSFLMAPRAAASSSDVYKRQGRGRGGKRHLLLSACGRRAATSDWQNPKKRLRDLHAEQDVYKRQGHSLPQNSTTTAMMAPSWMTTRNMDMNSSLALNLMICSSTVSYTHLCMCILSAAGRFKIADAFALAISAEILFLNL